MAPTTIDEAYYYKEHIDEAFEADLSNKVHPLFQWRGWSGYGNHFQHSDHAITLMARRLASRFVTADCVLPFWHAVLFGKRTKIPSPSETPGKLQFEIEEPLKVLTPEQVAETRGRLEELAGFVAFNIYEHDPSSGQVEAKMSCRPTSEWGDISDTKWGVDPPFTGDMAEILIPTSTMVRFRKEVNADSLTKAWATVKFARTLVHELTHAVIHATALVKESGYCASGFRPSYYVGNAVVCEDGFEFESRCLGGILTTSFDKEAYSTVAGVDTAVKGMLVALDWPAPDLVETYCRLKSPIGIRGDVPNIWFAWRVPVSYLRELLSDAHWEGRVHQEGLVALRPKKEIGKLDCGKDYKGRGLMVPEGYDMVEGHVVVLRR